MNATSIVGTDGRLLGLWWQAPPLPEPPPPDYPTMRLPEPAPPDYQAELDAIQERLDAQEQRLTALEAALEVELNLYRREHPPAKDPHELE
jgi:hypothetical protein